MNGPAAVTKARMKAGVRAVVQVNPAWLLLMLSCVVLANTQFNPVGQQGLLSFTFSPAALLILAVAAFPFIPSASFAEEGERLGQGPPRRWAWCWVVFSVIAVVVGLLLYSAHAPLGADVLPVELGGSGQQVPLDPGLNADLRWDFALIVGYGTALWMATTAATWVFWTPRAAGLARLGRGFTTLVVLADVVEDVALGVTFHDPSVTWPLDVAAAAATVKFALLVPAAVIAIIGLLVMVGRLLSSVSWPWSQDSRDDWAAVTDGDLVGALPVEVAGPPDGAPAKQAQPAVKRAAMQELRAAHHAVEEADGSPADGAEQRWRAGYNVPGWTAPEKDTTAVGFCLSGGGIRSASVAMGFLQEMRETFLKAKYVVSVSGGGYTSGALTLALTDAAVGTDAGRLVATGTIQRHTEDAYQAGSPEFDHLRRHSSYIAATATETLQALVVVARGLIASFAVLFGPAVPLGILTAWAYYRLPLANLPGPGSYSEAAPTGTGLTLLPRDAGLEVPQRAVAALGAVLVLAVLLWLVHTLTQYASGPRLRAVAGWAVTRAAITGWAIFTVFMATLGIPVLLWVTGWLEKKTGTTAGVGGSVGAVLLSYLASLAMFLWRRRTTLKLPTGTSKDAPKSAAVPNGLLQLLLVLVTLLVLSAFWLLLFGVAALHTIGRLALEEHPALPDLWLFLAVLAVVIVIGGVLDESSISLHPFYRRRLASAFATRRVRFDDGPAVAVPYDPREPTTLSVYGKVDTPSMPYPEVIFAAAANLTGEHRTAAGLSAVSFTMNSQWCGGPDVGWVRTSTLESISPQRLRQDLTVQAAVAISGAAIASAMGRAARWYQILLAITGARLGAWLPNPSFVQQMHAARGDDGGTTDWTLPGLPRIRRMPYLLREVFNLHSSTDRLLEITDGGHYENLGIVELLRRRCGEIYCVDGGGDTPPTAEGLAEAIALAYSELGVTITLTDPWTSEPGSGKPLDPKSTLTALNQSLSQSPIIRGTFEYPEAAGIEPRTGTIVIARALLWRQLPYELLTYAVRHPVFPHDSTSDQWFDDGQFGAYTQLGRELAIEMKGRPGKTVPA